MLVHALAFQQKSVDFIWRVEKMEDTVTELKKILGSEADTDHSDQRN